jgi:hypothetical protein
MEDLRLAVPDLFIRQCPLQIANATLCTWICGTLGDLWREDILRLHLAFERFCKALGKWFACAFYVQQPYPPAPHVDLLEWESDH